MSDVYDNDAFSNMSEAMQADINVDENKIERVLHLNTDRKIDLTSGLFCPYIQANVLSKSSIHSIPS